MNHIEKLEEATIKALQHKLNEDNEKKYISERGEDTFHIHNKNRNIPISY